jgi:formate hydrogenlyase transcriptional activator
MAEDSRTSLATEHGRYRALMEISSALASQPNLQAALQSLRNLLSKVVAFDSVALLLLDDREHTLRLIALGHGPDTPRVDMGIEAPYIGTAIDRALTERKPVFIQDIQEELRKTPELVARIPVDIPQSCCVFPVLTSRKVLGVLVFSSAKADEVGADDLELMSSVSSHVAVALESALAFDAAEEYERELGRERDRLKLLLKINNHIVTKLDIHELFHSAAASIREYFGNDFSIFSLIDQQAQQFECAALDFPESWGFMTDRTVKKMTPEDTEKMRTRTIEILSKRDIDSLPEVVTEPLRAESIVSMAVVPLVISQGPLGALALGSRRLNHFNQTDADLLTQIGYQISLALENAVAYGRLTTSKDRLEDERLYLESEIRAESNFDDIVGHSPALKKVLDQVAVVAPTESSVLLYGETGTGKELIARAIHNLSSRRERTFVRLNCAAIPSGLVESELFGHEKGAFTGALMQKRGRFELADKGTLFLDEIGDISLELQPKLLRALQEREFERLGSTKTIRVNVRLIAATHRDLSAMIRNGQFREDLFYRLSVFPLEIPPLRERREDIPLLVHYFVSRLSRRMRKQIKTVPKQVMDALVSCDWPGNIRELRNLLERAIILTQGEELNVPLAELQMAQTRSSTPRVSSFQAAEREAILNALKLSNGRLSGPGGAAESLGLKRTTLQNKMRRLNISSKDLQRLP